MSKFPTLIIHPPCIARLASRQAGATQCTRGHDYMTFDLLMGLPTIGMLHYQYLMDVSNILYSLPWSSTRVTNIWPNRTWSLPRSYRSFIVLFTVILSVFAHLYRISATHSFTNYQCAPLNQIEPLLQGQCKHPYRSLPSPSWIMVTNWDLGNEFPFRHRDTLTSRMVIPRGNDNRRLNWIAFFSKYSNSLSPG